MKRIFIVLLAIIPLVLTGQKKPLEHSVYDEWKSLSSSQVTGDGRYISYEINPQEGDGTLFLYNRKDDSRQSFERGDNASFSPGNNYFVYKIVPTYSETRQAKKDKKKPDEMPKDDLGIKVLGSAEQEVIKRVKSFKLPSEEGDWMAYLMEKPLPEDKEKEGEDAEEKEEKEASANGGRGGKKNGAEGTELVILNPVKEAAHSFKDVIDYEVAAEGTVISYVQVEKDTADIKTYTVSVFNTGKEESQEIFRGEGSLKNMVVYKDGSQVSFVYTSDTSDVKVYDLYLWNGGESVVVLNATTAGMPEGWSVSENGNLSFSDSGERLFFGTAEKPEEEPEDTLLADEKYKLDVWSWHDPLLQPQQKQQLQREKKRTYDAVYHIDDKKMVQLATEEIPGVRYFKDKDGDRAIGVSNLKYRKLSSWDASSYADYYLIDVKTGDSELILEKAPSSVEFSPSGEKMLFWCVKSKSWKARNTEGGEVTDLTSGLDVMFHNELHDSPSEPRPYGVINKWVEGEKYVLIYDRYDIWKFDVSGSEEPVMVTGGSGRKENINFRYTSLSPRGSDESEYLEKRENIYLTAFDEKTKDAGLFRTRIDRTASPEKIIMQPYSFRSFAKAEDEDIIIYQKGTFEEYP
ncbi:MAG: hypothetical protein ACLFN1_04930, partial [Bacteroidales bacterium]